jgi:hypothetical protein
MTAHPATVLRNGHFFRAGAVQEQFKENFGSDILRRISAREVHTGECGHLYYE